ncbi:MAG: patatin-like phospholipase family protein [Anaeromassilibacillus sp.]
MSVGLVLEGGGTRGAYTSGVLDVFNENQIVFPVVYGISAGACNALSYISGQVGRNFRIFYDYIQDDRYMSVSSLRKTGNLFGFDFIFGELSHKLLPFDYQAFFASPTQLMAGTTDLHTGEAIFFWKRGPGRRLYAGARFQRDAVCIENCTLSRP